MPSPPLAVRSVLYSRLTWTDWSQIHGGLAVTGGGGGSHLPLDKIEIDKATSQYLGTADAPVVLNNVVAIGNGASAPITFKNWSTARNQWIIPDQVANRHPAIGPGNGFPQANDARLWNGTGRTSRDWAAEVTVYLVLCHNGQHYMGYWVGPKPADWPEALADVFDGAGRIGRITVPDFASIDAVTSRVLGLMAHHKNLLLYGPPGTGKTRVLHQLLAAFEDPGALTGLVLDPGSLATPFVEEANGFALDGPVFVDWSTFHQRTSYEEFVVGLRPKPSGGALKLQPRAGRLLEAVHAIENRGFGSAVLLIDEVNRADAAAVLGELITFLEPDKRGIGFYPAYLSADPADPERSEEIDFRDGPGTLRFPIQVPPNLYVIGTMNALDRSIAPLDQALARRFYRVESSPDMEYLRHALGVGQDGPDPETLMGDEGAGQTAYYLLDRINRFVRHTVGRDAQFGHGYLAGVWEAEEGAQRWSVLVDTWDHSLFPQLEEFFRGRPEVLRAILMGDGPPKWYPYRLESPPGGLADSYEEDQILIYESGAINSLASDHQREALLHLATGTAHVAASPAPTAAAAPAAAPTDPVFATPAPAVDTAAPTAPADKGEGDG